MARKQVLEVVCDRCKRVETQEPSESPRSAETDGYKELSLTFNGRTIEYEDLCLRCRKAISGYVKQIAKEVENEPKEPKKRPDKLVARIAG